MNLQAKHSFTGPRMRGNPMTKLTGVLGFIFMCLCLLLVRMNIQSQIKPVEPTITVVSSTVTTVTPSSTDVKMDIT